MVAANFSERKFGVEIECIGMTIPEVKKLFKDNQIPVTDNNENYSKWSVKEDGSIRGEYIDTQVDCYVCRGQGTLSNRGNDYVSTCSCSECQATRESRRNGSNRVACWGCSGSGKRTERIAKGCEVVSPILSGNEGLLHLQKVCTLLKMNGVSANASCGLHVHVFAKDYKKIQVLNVFQRYAKFEKDIDEWVKYDRRQNRNSYCFSTTSSHVTDEISLDDIFGSLESNAKSLEEKVSVLYSVIVNKQANTTDEKKVGKAVIDSYFNIDRHCKINLSSYLDLGTVEFRHHHGTVDPIRIKNWVMFCVQFFEQSMAEQQPENETVYTGIGSGVKSYFSGVAEKRKTAAGKKKATKKKATKKRATQ